MIIEIEIPDEVYQALIDKAVKDSRYPEETINEILYEYLDEYGFI